MMKRILIFAVALLAVMGSACTKRTVDDSPLTKPSSLTLPRSGYALDLKTGQPLIFDWEYSLGGNVRYQIVFDKENGDFSQPIYAVLSDNNGFTPSVTISAEMLRSVARLAGCEVGKSVNVIWTVRTFKGQESVTGVQNGAPRVLTLTLPFEVDPLPLTVTLSGTSLESGADTEMEHALPVSESESAGPAARSTAAFSVYSYIKSGTLLLTDDRNRTFSLMADGQVVAHEEAAAPASPFTTDELRCLTVDFEKLSWTSVTVSDVWFWNRPWDVDGAYQSRMTYLGGGEWTVTVNPFRIALVSHSGYDSRYHFRIDYNGAPTDRVGPFKADVNVSEIGTEGFYNAYRYSDAIGNQWAYSWKTPEDATWDGASVVVVLKMRGETYTHTISLQ